MFTYLLLNKYKRDGDYSISVSLWDSAASASEEFDIGQIVSIDGFTVKARALKIHETK
jgi:hypothetical protein